MSVTLNDLLTRIAEAPGQAVHVLLPDNQYVPSHFHVTEAGRVVKDFVDCGGTVRNAVSCVLQVWVANDLEHRLTTTKLEQIIRKGLTILKSTDVPLEIEFDNGLISQYPVLQIDDMPDGFRLQLGTKHTACLAPDRCAVPLSVLSSCSSPGCC